LNQNNQKEMSHNLPSLPRFTSTYHPKQTTMVPDELSILLSQLSISPSSSTASSPSEETSFPTSNECMTTLQRLHKLKEMRTSLQQRLLLLLVKAQHINRQGSRKDVEAEVEEYRDLLDGMDVLIQRLSKEQNGENGDTRDAEEWRGTYEL
jgi:hypothetical protein